MKLIPLTQTGKWSLALICGLPIFIIIGTLFANFYYDVSAGGTILKDLAIRPLVGIFSLSGIAFGITSLILGLIAIFWKKERALLIYIPIIVGLLLVFLLLAELGPGLD